MEDKNIVVIAKRGKGAFKALTIIAVILGAICLGLGILGIVSGQDFLVVGIVGAVLGALLLVLGCIKFGDYAKNAKNKNDCIVYNKKSKKLVLSTISGAEVEINLDDYITSSCSFGSDLMLMIRFNYEGKEVKLNLGYCENRVGVHERIVELRK